MTSIGEGKKSKAQLETEKKAAAEAALLWVRDGMRLGLGTGSTANYFIKALGEHLRSRKLRIHAIPTSTASQELAKQYGIPLIPPEQGLRLDLGVDGADEIGRDLDLIKGGGGALLREKVIARAAREFLVVADSSKMVERLGTFPLPVEVIPFTLPWVSDEISRLGGNPVLRMSKQNPNEAFLTDQRNNILDCHFGVIENPEQLARQLKEVPGIAEHGLFSGYAKMALVADGTEVLVYRPGRAPVALSEFEDKP